MSDFQNQINRFEERHRELLEAAAQARRHGSHPSGESGAWALAVASALERISAAIRSRYESTPKRPAASAASAWRTS